MGQFERFRKLFQSIFFFYFIASKILSNLVNADSDPPFPFCSNITDQNQNSTFQINLNNFFLSLPSISSNFTQFRTTFGDNISDTIYGQYMCLNYVSNDTCTTCITTASQAIRQLCPDDKEALVWEENCFLRYSNRSFFGHLDVSGNLPLYNKKNISDPDQFRSVVNRTVSDLIVKASSNFSAKGESEFGDSETVFGLVQCSEDLSSDDCKTCLRIALMNVSNCCYFYRGARVLSQSCYLRYELYAFYRGETEASASPENAGTSKRKIWIVIVPTSTAVVMLVVACSCFIYKIASKGKNRSAFQVKSLQGRRNESGFIDLESIYAATNHFSELNLLGQGGFGPVYKGKLSDEKEVAVKRLSSLSEQGTEEFTNEVVLIMKLQHKNLVRLLGFCVDAEEKILVYEFMPNSSLDVILFDSRKRAELDWSRRIKIINGIAKGILYLHEDSRLRIIHRDLKASNILLDDEMNPKISDFGMARIFASSHGEANTARIVGTYGYMAPEYAMEGIYSTKSDVFSFGVLLLEIITGRRNADFHRSRNAPSLTAYAWHLWNIGNEVTLIDPMLCQSCCPDEFSRQVHIGLLCVQEDALDRPTMSSVVLMLKSETVALPQPGKPALSQGRFADQFRAESNDVSVNGLTSSVILPR
ncbi:cysteine-rich RLK (RECEPTOR-like protein kinase) 10 [Euphorbia peplus]|nr:cysteine-rich RLK (RECEPTOR-like protein kinase) 10 [Euphorbia peplus]